MIPKTDSKNKKKLVCKRCGAVRKEDSDNLVREKGTEDKGVEVVENEQEVSYPLTDIECPKCGHGRAYYWLLQTRAADEAETRFFRCEKCKYTWREND